MPKQEVGAVAYLDVLDEIADSKEPVLHIISDLYVEYVCKHEKKFVVLEGDAKTYDVMQAIKHEYGSDLNWLIPYPGDWHLLKNFQICLFKPFFEAGLKELCTAVGYPAASVQSCSNFKRTHRFIMEVWESMYRHVLKIFMLDTEHDNQITQELEHTLRELEKEEYDATAMFSVIRSLQEKLTGMDDDFKSFIDGKAEVDDTWHFWVNFIFEDGMAYIALFMAIRSGNWNLRMAALKLMAADFAAYDHPNYQKLITQHIMDVLHMPEELVQYLQGGGFALSITGRPFHSVGLDECHEMLINRHVKEAIVRPSPDYISRVAKYIPTRMKSIEH